MSTELSTHPAIDLLADALSPITRKERRNLLGLSIVSLFVSEAGLVPSRISALGIDFDRTDQANIQIGLAAIVAYFLITFTIYSWSDFLGWRFKLIDSTDRYAQFLADKDARKMAPHHEAATHRLHNAIGSSMLFMLPILRRHMLPMARISSVVRASNDFLLPIAIGLFAYYRLI